jgi:putative membrane protein
MAAAPLPLLAPDELARVEAAIRAAEAKSRAEIVLAISPRSADYGRWLALPVLLATLALATAAHLALPRLPPLLLLGAQLPIAALLWVIASRPAVTRALVPNGVEIEAVRREALRLFAEKALFETEGRTGVLLYLSALERRVEILADRGLAAHVDRETWRAHVAHLVQAIHERRAAAGLCEVVDRIGDRVAAALGPEATPRNELPDRL